MLICRTPFRVSFFGGGTDYPTWYLRNNGQTISTTINKYSYISLRELPPFFDYKHRIRYFRREEVNTINEIQHPSVRECANFLNINQNIEVVHSSDLPARSGLGSSSSFTVGMLHSLYTLKHYMPTKKELGLNAIHVEQNLIQESVGSQDQMAAAFGGLNSIEYKTNGEIIVSPLIMNKQRKEEFHSRLLLCFTGFQRTASEIAEKQIDNIKHREKELKEIGELCDEAYKCLSSGDSELNTIGELLNEQWKIKKQLASNVSNSRIDDIYDVIIHSGALGAKLMGAGGGGFMLIYAERHMHKKIVNELDTKMFVPFQLESTGSQIIYYSHD